MKNIKHITWAAILALAISSSALAGDISAGRTAGDISAGRTAAAGDISAGKTALASGFVDLVLTIFSVIG